MDHLEGLNERQREAVLTTEGPLLIIAGAGAGKTRVLTHRIIHLIKGGVAPEAILAVTFTNKAAREMRERVQTLLARDPVARHLQTPPVISTFHSLGVQIIREHSAKIGLPARFTIFDRSDSISAIKEAIKKAGHDPKSIEPGKMLAAISREKGRMVTGTEFRERVGSEYFAGVVAEVWERYEEILKGEKALDFDDLLLKTATLLKTDASVRERYQRQWRYLHIDEYQDTNHVQYMMARILAAEHTNIAVVGDIDQNIYSWRGASIKNILDFEKDYPEAKVVVLEENYRSTQTILTVANRVIEKNTHRREKTLFTKNAEGEKVGLYVAYDEQDEATFVARRSKELIASGVAPKEIAVFFRANFQSRVLEEAFLREQVPYIVLSVRFLERKEVKDVIAYLRAARNPEGVSDLGRIINVPPRGIGKVTLLKVLAGREAELPPATREKVRAFRRLLAELKDKLESEPLSSALKWIITASGLERELKKGGEDDTERLENIRELVSLSTRYDIFERAEGVERFLADVALASDQDTPKEEKNAVRLSTVHTAKGLEFEYVFITGLESGLFPHERMNETNETRDREEERRLFYVALTRAKKKLHLSYAGVRTLFGSRQVTVPSEFIFDIDEEFLEAEEKAEYQGKTVYLD